MGPRAGWLSDPRKAYRPHSVTGDRYGGEWPRERFRLVAQLSGLERRTARGGRDSIDHGPGQHDDVANAATGALLLTRTDAPMVIYPNTLAELAKFGRYGRRPPDV